MNLTSFNKGHYEDIKSLCDKNSILFPDSYEKCGEGLVLEEDGIAKGIIHFFIFGGHLAFVDCFVLSDEFRGKEIAGKMCVAMVKHLSCNGVENIKALCMDDSVGKFLLGVYRKLDSVEVYPMASVTLNVSNILNKVGENGRETIYN